jgi:hypothetical protein
MHVQKHTNTWILAILLSRFVVDTAVTFCGRYRKHNFSWNWEPQRRLNICTDFVYPYTHECVYDYMYVCVSTLYYRHLKWPDNCSQECVYNHACMYQHDTLVTSDYHKFARRPQPLACISMYVSRHVFARAYMTCSDRVIACTWAVSLPVSASTQCNHAIQRFLLSVVPAWINASRLSTAWMNGCLYAYTSNHA